MAEPAPDDPFRFDLAAGFAATVLAVVSFWFFHTVWILNIPAVFLEGLIHAGVAALALAWAVRSTRRRRPFDDSVAVGSAIGLLIWLTFVPYEVVGVLWGPIPDAEGAAEVLRVLPLAFVGVPVGAAVGWGLTKAARPTVACATAALTLDLVLGGGIAFEGGRGVQLGSLPLATPHQRPGRRRLHGDALVPYDAPSLDGELSQTPHPRR